MFTSLSAYEIHERIAAKANKHCLTFSSLSVIIEAENTREGSHMFNIEKFGLKIAQLRKRADMTQFELAERLNLTRQAISKYERGESFPDVTILVELAEGD